MKSHTTKRNYKGFIQLCILFVITAIMFSGCNTGGQQPGTSGGTANPTTATFKGTTTGVSTAGVGMNIQWSIDGLPIDTGKNVNDMAWHLLSLTVESMHAPLVTPIAVNGLNYAIYPLPKKDRGEKLEVEDINCKSAQFSKNGDTCNAYIRVTYDTTTGLDTPPVTPVQVVTNAYPTVSGMASIYVRPLFKFPQGSYRAILPIESKYYVGSVVTSNPKQYRILSMQNFSMPPLTITELSKTTNPTFTLMHRQSAENSDAYYGPYSECSLTANANLNQVNYLPGINSQCILVYQASMTSSQATQIESVKLVTNSDTTTVKTLKLIANYVTATPIPDRVMNISDFVVSEENGIAIYRSVPINTNMPFNQVKISYDFIPYQFHRAPDMPYYNNGVINVATGSPVAAGEPIVTDASSTNPITVGKVTQETIPNSNQVYLQLSELHNFTLQANNPIGVGRYRQSLHVMLGTQGVVVAQTIKCPIGSVTCTASGLYSNGLSSSNMSYTISMGTGDKLRSGKVGFIRSEGYDLADFIVSR